MSLRTILKCAEHRVAIFFIKLLCLKIEGIQMHEMTAFLHCLTFNFTKQDGPQPLSAILHINPYNVDCQYIPSCVAGTMDRLYSTSLSSINSSSPSVMETILLFIFLFSSNPDLFNLIILYNKSLKISLRAHPVTTYVKKCTVMKTYRWIYILVISASPSP